ncbi:hypothetical protein NERG_02083 [Nematocida ausubeli]|uniref:Uncharacterized protein n=1 Tax=Nematocida ausubeli (strain ATCC PRA-371 / ERTm2) TaxID=1913371 RepID=H8ZER2_NEMA1|nr:hypothetical protein NERG_02083 [Nematocida ausubeli]
MHTRDPNTFLLRVNLLSSCRCKNTQNTICLGSLIIGQNMLLHGECASLHIFMQLYPRTKKIKYGFADAFIEKAPIVVLTFKAVLCYTAAQLFRTGLLFLLFVLLCLFNADASSVCA